MTNDELIRLLFERVVEAQRSATEEEKYEAYCDMVGQDDADAPFYYAAQVISQLLLGRWMKLEEIPKLYQQGASE